MAEIRRVLLSRKMLILFVLAVVMNCVFFALECSDEKQITLQGEELTAYLESYPAFLASVSDNADSYSAISILRKQDSFSQANIAKTADDYSRLHITVQYGENRGIAAYSNYITPDFLLAAVVLFAVVSFSDERRKGIAGIVKCAKRGRLPLGVYRLVIIAIAAVTASAVFSLSTILTGNVIFGDAGLSRSLQSIPEFKLCPYDLTIIGYIVCSAALKALSAAVIGLVVYILSALFDTVPSIVFSSLILVGEYLFYVLIIPTDSLNILKFLNVFALLKNDVFFKNYCNLNIFGAPVYFLGAGVAAMIIFAVILSAVTLVTASRRTPGTVTEIGVLSKLGAGLSSKMPQLSLFMWEAKKVLINRKGLVILAAAIFLSIYSLVQYRYVGFTDLDFEKMYKKYSGVVDEALVERVTNDYNTLEAKVAELAAEIEARVEAGQSPGEYLTLYNKWAQASYELHLTGIFRERAEDCFAYTQSSGFSVEIIKQEVYELLFNSSSGTAQRNSLYILIALIGTFGGIMSCEKQSNMNFTLRSSKRGRLRVLAYKAAVIFIISIALSAVINLAQLGAISESIGLNNLEASCQSIIMLRSVPFAFTIREYLAVMYIVRALLTALVGLAVMGVSALCPNDMISFGASAALLIVPSVLKSAGVTFLFSFTEFISAVPR